MFFTKIIFFIFCSVCSLKNPPLWIDQNLDFSDIKAIYFSRGMYLFSNMIIDMDSLEDFVNQYGDFALVEKSRKSIVFQWGNPFGRQPGSTKLYNLFQLACWFRQEFIHEGNSRYLFLSSCIYVVLFFFFLEAFKFLLNFEKDQSLLRAVGRIMFNCRALYPDLDFSYKSEEDVLSIDTRTLEYSFLDLDIFFPHCLSQNELRLEDIINLVDANFSVKKEKIIKMLFARKEIVSEITKIIQDYYGRPDLLGRRHLFFSVFEDFFETQLIFRS